MAPLTFFYIVLAAMFVLAAWGAYMVLIGNK